VRGDGGADQRNSSQTYERAISANENNGTLGENEKRQFPGKERGFPSAQTSGDKVKITKSKEITWTKEAKRDAELPKKTRQEWGERRGGGK